jgi:hypothetical protein
MPQRTWQRQTLQLFSRLTINDEENNFDAILVQNDKPAAPAAAFSHQPVDHRKRKPVSAAGVIGICDQQRQQGEAERPARQPQPAQDQPADAAGKADQLSRSGSSASVHL